METAHPQPPDHAETRGGLRGFLRRHKTLIRWSLAIILLGGIAFFLAKNYQKLGLLLELHVGWLIGLLGWHVLIMLNHAGRMYLIVRKFSRERLPFGAWVRLFVFGRLINLFIAQGGNVYRTVALKSRYGVAYTHYVATLLFFTWVDTAMNCLLAVIFIAAFDRSLMLWTMPAYQALLVFLLLVVLAPLVVAWLLGRYRPKGRLASNIRNRLFRVLLAGRDVIFDPKTLAGVLGGGVVSFALMVGAFWACFTAMGVRVDPLGLTVLYTLYKLSLLLVITPGNLGVREIGIGIICQGLGIDIAEALLASLILRFSHYLSLGIFSGLISIPKALRILRRDPPSDPAV